MSLNISSDYYLPFPEALKEVLQQFGVSELTRSNLTIKESLSMDYDVCLIVGITDDIKGNLGISMPSQTALKIASLAMGGMEVSQLDEISKSALTEISNMITAAASIKLSNLNKSVDISPPTLVTGENLTMIISQVDTVSITLDSSAGPFQINIGLETIA